MITVKAKNNYGRDKIPSIEADIYFIPVIDGEECNRPAETEDMALLIGLGVKYDGLNTQFPRLAARMLGIDSLWSQ